MLAHWRDVKEGARNQGRLPGPGSGRQVDGDREAGVGRKGLWPWLACGLEPASPSDPVSFLPAACLPGSHVRLTLGLRPLGLGGKQAVWENCVPEKAGCTRMTRVFC